MFESSRARHDSLLESRALALKVALDVKGEPIKNQCRLQMRVLDAVSTEPFLNMKQISDELWMQKALETAHRALQKDEVPVGAVLILGDFIFRSEGNEREATSNPMGHAEIMAIQKACFELETWRLPNSTLYVTVEPCVMCTGLIYQTRIKRVVFGCKNPKGGALQFISQNERKLGLNHTLEITQGVLEKDCAEILQNFFQKRRNQTRLKPL